uniref:Uncharacterized protein AlNc14C43G3569 n=1 Tax=Albugo laibachii Nc14 TaxID=890382 RepID=F0WA25_9STRA|nr:conserved hypothetical protein [Albugo laibachii Nc14]|eukprot:CCA17995.1 conserved hypothetical protein [Albugo laibachii Nc14]
MEVDGETVAYHTTRKRSVTEVCREAIAELESWSLWAYRDATGEEWDAQPACFITDYILGLQCFGFAAYLGFFDSERFDQVSIDLMRDVTPFRISQRWYVIYFIALGISAIVGGFLHHVAYEALRSFAHKEHVHFLKTARVFGMQIDRRIVDKCIEIAWRIVLACSILTNFALLAIAASRYLTESWAYTMILVTATCYIAITIYATICMHTAFLMVGYLPAMIFGGIFSWMAFDWQWMSAPSHEIIVYALKLASGIIQGLVVSPSKHRFNHNAFSHVIMSAAATFMFIHVGFDKFASLETDSDSRQKMTNVADANLVCCVTIDFQALYDIYEEQTTVSANSLLQNAQIKMDIAPYSRRIVCAFKDTIYLTMSSTLSVSENSSCHSALHVIENGESEMQIYGQTETKESDIVTFSDARWVTDEYFCISETNGFIYLYHYQDGLKLKQVGTALQVEENVAQVSKFQKYKAPNQGRIEAVSSCHARRPSLFQSHARVGSSTVISIGLDPFISFYHAENDQNSAIHIAHIATAIATRAAGAVWSYARSWGWNSPGDEGGTILPIKPNESSQSSPTSKKSFHSSYLATEHVAAPLKAIATFTEDSRRRCRMLIVSPCGRVAALADSLGRVMLVDTWRMIIIRMWKGYRNAQCGWFHGYEGDERTRGLYLAIYSEQRGTIDVWRARYGPRVASIPIGPSARLFTRSDTEYSTSCCYVLYPTEGSQFHLKELSFRTPNPNILVRYFVQNKCQEEKYLLHQFVGQLQALAMNREDTQEMTTLGPDSLRLERFDQLDSVSSVETLLEILGGSETSSLRLDIRLSVLGKLEQVLGRIDGSNFDGNLNRTKLLARILWYIHVTRTFQSLKGSFYRAKPDLEAFLKDESVKSIAPASIFAQNACDEWKRSRLFPWLELYRRAGYLLSDEGSTRIWYETIEEANALEISTFSEIFKLPIDRMKEEEIIHVVNYLKGVRESKGCEHEKNTLMARMAPYLSTRLSTTIHARSVIMLLHGPILSNVFEIQEIQRLHCSIFLPPGKQVKAFLGWYFGLPLTVVLALAPPSQSSPLQRWIEYYYGSERKDEFDQEDAVDSCSEPAKVRQLLRVSGGASEIYSTCLERPEVFHAYILSLHCQHAELNYGRQLEEMTLGKFSSIAAGVRWEILQDGLARTVFISLCLGRVGRLCVDAVEQLDEVLRGVALLQLNHPTEIYSNISQMRQKRSGDALNKGKDTWVHDLESCRSGKQMKSWKKILTSFPQLDDFDSLQCFRANLLCAAWNSARSEMHQLGDAVVELQQIRSSSLRAAMGVHIWEKYLKAHVLSLYQYWEDRAAGKSPKRTLQPQMARQFFHIVIKFLEILIRVSSYMNVKDDSSEENDTKEEDDVGSSDAGDSEEDIDGSVYMSEAASSTQWRYSVIRLREKFRQHWPPPARHSKLTKRFTGFKLEMLSTSLLMDHRTLVLLLDGFTATTLKSVPIRTLLPDHRKLLCSPNALISDQTVQILNDEEREVLQASRARFLQSLLECDPHESLVYSLADAFSISKEDIRASQALILYRSGQDTAAEPVLNQMREPQRLVMPLGSIVRTRVALVLQRMKADAEYANVMSSLPADVSAWILALDEDPFVYDEKVMELDSAPSLRATDALIIKCMLYLRDPSRVRECHKMSQLSALVKIVIAYVKNIGSM